MFKDLTLEVFVSVRPRQWIKNLVVFAAILFSKELFILSKFTPVFYTFLIFCAASSSMYLINDIADRNRDKLHFSKKDRPIAAGNLSVRTAAIVALFLASVALISSTFISPYLVPLIAIYLVIQLFYTFILKEIIILDVIAISFTFMLRIFAGSIVVLTPLSSWLIITTMMFALFLSVGKRRSEFTLLTKQQGGQHRKTLLFYPQQLLDGLVFMMATAILITYSLFTFNSPEIGGNVFYASVLPQTLATSKLLMATIPIVAYRAFRYLYLIFEESAGASPATILISDKPLFFTVFLWFFSVIFFLYASNI